MDLKETKSFLRRYNVSPSRFRGQNFLIDPSVAKKEVEAAGLSGSEVVLEVGPGLGALTEHLLDAGCTVIAVEKDRVLVKILQERFGARDIEIIEADILKIDLPKFDVVVSNPPYVISSPLTFRLLEHGFTRGVLTYQEEFAMRLTAKPGDWDYSRLSVAASYHSEVEVLWTMSPRAFYPPPKVRSAVVRITPISPPFEVDEDLFFRLVRGMFTVRRKNTKNAILIANKLEGVGVDIDQVPEEMLEKRVFELTPMEIAQISNLG